VFAVVGLAFWWVNILVTRYQAQLNVKPLSLGKFSMFNHISFVSFTRESMYCDVLSVTRLPLKSVW